MLTKDSDFATVTAWVASGGKRKAFISKDGMSFCPTKGKTYHISKNVFGVDLTKDETNASKISVVFCNVD